MERRQAHRHHCALGKREEDSTKNNAVFSIKDKAAKTTTTTDSCPVCGGDLEYMSVIKGPKGVSQIFKCVSCGVAVFR